MDKRKQQMVEQLFNSLKGRQLNNALPVITNWNMQLKNENISFSQEENDMLAQMFMQELNPAQMRQFEMLKSLMKKGW